MDKIDVSEDLVRDYADKVNPNFSTRVETIGRATAIIYEGVKLVPSLQEKLYGKTFSDGLEPIFDYVDFNLEDIVSHSPEDKDSIRDEYDWYKQKGQVDENGILTHPHFEGMNFDQFQKEVAIRRKEQLKNMSDWTPGQQIRPVDQGDKIKNDLTDLFGENSAEAEEEFKKVINKNPKRPFLIIHGHGGAERIGGDPEEGLPSKQVWNVGGENLSVIFDKLNVSKYSAILVVSCNEAQIEPPKVKGPVIFYDERLVGFGTFARNIERTPTKYTKS